MRTPPTCGSGQRGLFARNGSLSLIPAIELPPPNGLQHHTTPAQLRRALMTRWSFRAELPARRGLEAMGALRKSPLLSDSAGRTAFDVI